MLFKRLQTLWRLSGIEVDEPSTQAKSLSAIAGIFKKPQAEIIKYEKQSPVDKIIQQL